MKFIAYLVVVVIKVLKNKTEKTLFKVVFRSNGRKIQFQINCKIHSFKIEPTSSPKYFI